MHFFFFFFFMVFANFCLQKSTLSKTNSTCNTEKYQLVIRFGKAKHLKVSVILFKRARTFFLKNEKKRLLDFPIQVFHIQLLKQTQNSSKIRRLDCGSLLDFSEILKIISECIFCWITIISNHP